MIALYGFEEDAHPPACTCVGCTAVQLADGEFDIRWRKIPQTVTDDFLEGVWDQTVLPNRLHKGMWQEHFDRLLNHAQAGWGQPFTQADSLERWQMFQKMQSNLAQVAAFKQHRMAEELRAAKIRHPQRSDWDEAAAKVMARHNGQWLRAELQASTAAAAAAESWQEFERRKYLYPNLRYETAGDERVRQSHRSLDGVVRSVDDPFWDVYYPPNGWNCRCVVVQTDARPTEDGEVDFDPPKGFRGNVGKTGQLFGQDHPYFNVGTLDKEAVEAQARNFLAASTRNNVREWASTDLVPSFQMSLPGMSRPATLTNGEVKTVTGKPHQAAASRNNLLYVLATALKKAVFVGRADDIKGHQNVKGWYYYLLELGGVKYRFNFWERVEDDGKTRIGLHAITDAPDRGP